MSIRSALFQRLPGHLEFMISAAVCCISAGTVSAGVPVGIDVLKLRTVLHNDVRVIWFGDSYALPYEGRVSGGSLLSWRFDAWTAVTLGDGPNWFFIDYVELQPSINSIHSANGYRLYQTGPDAVVRYALPVWRLREMYADDSASGPIDTIRYSITQRDTDVGFQGPFLEVGDTANIRQLFLEPPGTPPMLAGMTITPDGGTPLWFNPTTSTRPKRLDGLDPQTDAPTPPADGQISAAPFDVPITADTSGRLTYTLSADAPASGHGYIFPAGFAAYKTQNDQRQPGVYFGAITDSSWSYMGFGLDTTSGTPGAPVKTFSREQLAHWLDATTIDPAQPIYAFYLLAVEDIPQADAAEHMAAMVDQTSAASADAGLGPVHHCIVIPWMHRINGQDILGRHEEQRDAAFALAQAREDVSAVSIYDFTEGHVFDGNAASRQWLADNGYDNFTYGSITVDLSADGGGANGGLLDIFRSHPQGRDAGAFFAHIIERVFVDACPADYATPQGVLDLADISGFLTRFLSQAPSADLAPPAGVFDLADVQAFVVSFSAGCAN